MIRLTVSVGQAAVTLVLGICKGHDDDVFDGIVSGFVVLEGAFGMLSVPCDFVGKIGGEVGLGLS